MHVQRMEETSIVMKKSPIVDQILQQKFEKVAIRRLIRKLDWRLLPYMLLIEIGSYINRTSIGK